MGSFDRINFKCPNCNNNIEVQSKGGICNNKLYNHTSVPICSAEYIMNDIIDCDSCGSKFKVSTNLPRIPLFLEELDGTSLKYD